MEEIEKALERVDAFVLQLRNAERDCCKKAILSDARRAVWTLDKLLSQLDGNPSQYVDADE